MSSNLKKYGSSLALATAAFISMPLSVNAQERSACNALRTVRAKRRVRVENAGPWCVRMDEKGRVIPGDIDVNVWNSDPNALPVRVGAAVYDLRVGKRLDCVEARMRGGEGKTLSIPIDDLSFPFSDGDSLVGIRVAIIHDPASNVRRKTPLPRVAATVNSKVLCSNETITK